MGSPEAHKYSNVGQSRNPLSRQEDGREGRDPSKDGARDPRESKDPNERREIKETWDKGQPKEAWDKSNSGAKSEGREWRDGKQNFGAQLQAQNNRGIKSRIRHPIWRKRGRGPPAQNRLQEPLQRVG